MVAPLVHKKPNATDEDLEAEATDELGSNPVRQVMSELFVTARKLDLAWWTPKACLTIYTVDERLKDLDARPDLRVQFLDALVPGMPAKMARRMSPEKQALFINEALLEDIPHAKVEGAYAPDLLALYGKIDRLYFQICDAFPWEENTPPHKELIKSFLQSLLNAVREWKGKKLTPVLKPHDVLTAIDSEVWETHVRKDVRVKIRDAWLKLEATTPGKPHTAAMTLEIVTIDGLDDIPVECLKPLFDLAGKKMGFARPEPVLTDDKPDDNKSTEAAPVTTKPENTPTIAPQPTDDGPKSPAKPPPIPRGTSSSQKMPAVPLPGERSVVKKDTLDLMLDQALPTENSDPKGATGPR